MEELPANASEAPTDKIYATGDSVVTIKKYDGGLKVHTPDFEAIQQKQSKKFLENLKKDKDIATVMTHEEIEACFDVKKMLSHVDTIFARFGL